MLTPLTTPPQNLEVAFMYKCEKFGRESNRERHIHLLTQFYVGLAGWAQIRALLSLLRWTFREM